LVLIDMAVIDLANAIVPWRSGSRL